VYNFLDCLANSLLCQLVNQIHFVHNVSSGILLVVNLFVVNLLQHLMTIGAFQETLVQTTSLKFLSLFSTDCWELWSAVSTIHVAVEGP
jgi:hypothetical protein